MAGMIPVQMAKTVVCPVCHGALRFNHDFSKLRCVLCGRRYPVRDEIPILLAQEAEDSAG